MGKIRLYFRLKQRQQSDPQDYFDQMKEKYGKELNFLPMTTYYLPICEGDVALARSKHYMIADTVPHPSLVIKEMIGEMEVESQEAAHDVAIFSGDDHVFAEYVVPFRLDREPA